MAAQDSLALGKGSFSFWTQGGRLRLCFPSFQRLLGEVKLVHFGDHARLHFSEDSPAETRAERMHRLSDWGESCAFMDLYMCALEDSTLSVKPF